MAQYVDLGAAILIAVDSATLDATNVKADRGRSLRGPTHMTFALGGGRLAPKTTQKEQIQLISVCSTREGVNKSEIFADVVCVMSPWLLAPGGQTTIKRCSAAVNHTLALPAMRSRAQNRAEKQGTLEPADIQRLTKRLVRGCENFVLALAYLLCLALPGFCLARFTFLFVPLCKVFCQIRSVLCWSQS